MSLSISTVGDVKLVTSFMCFIASWPTLNARPGYKYLFRFTPFCAGSIRIGGGVLITLVLGGVGGVGGTDTGTGVIGGELLAAVVCVFARGCNTCLEGPVFIILPGLLLATVPVEIGTNCGALTVTGAVTGCGGATVTGAVTVTTAGVSDGALVPVVDDG